MASPLGAGIDPAALDALDEIGGLAAEISWHLVEQPSLGDECYAGMRDSWHHLIGKLRILADCEILPESVLSTLRQLAAIVAEARQDVVEDDLGVDEARRDQDSCDLAVLRSSPLQELGAKIRSEAGSLKEIRNVPTTQQRSAAPIRRFWLLARATAKRLSESPRGMDKDIANTGKTSGNKRPDFVFEVPFTYKQATTCAKEMFPSLSSAVSALKVALDSVLCSQPDLDKLQTACAKLRKALDQNTSPDFGAVNAVGIELAELAEQLPSRVARLKDGDEADAVLQLQETLYREAGEHLLRALEHGGFCEDEEAVNVIGGGFAFPSNEQSQVLVAIRTMQRWLPSRVTGLGWVWERYLDSGIDRDISQRQRECKRVIEALRALSVVVRREGQRLEGAVDLPGETPPRSLAQLLGNLAIAFRREAAIGPSLGRTVISPDDWALATWQAYPIGERWPATVEASIAVRNGLHDCTPALADRISGAVNRVSGYTSTFDGAIPTSSLEASQQIVLDLQTLVACLNDPEAKKPPPKVEDDDALEVLAKKVRTLDKRTRPKKTAKEEQRERRLKFIRPRVEKNQTWPKIADAYLAKYPDDRWRDAKDKPGTVRVWYRNNCDDEPTKPTN